MYTHIYIYSAQCIHTHTIIRYTQAYTQGICLQVSRVLALLLYTNAFACEAHVCDPSTYIYTYIYSYRSLSLAIILCNRSADGLSNKACTTYTCPVRGNMPHGPFAVACKRLAVAGCALRLQADALRLQANALRLLAAALRRQADALRLQAGAMRLVAAALRRQADALRLQADALRLHANALREQAIPSTVLAAPTRG